MNAFLFFHFFLCKIFNFQVSESKVYFYFIFVTLMANTGHTEECAYSMNSWTVCDSYHLWLFQAIPLMHVC